MSIRSAISQSVFWSSIRACLPACMRACVRVSVRPSVSHSVSPLVGRSVGQSVSRSVSQSVSQSVNQSVNLSVSQSLSQSVSQSVIQSVGGVVCRVKSKLSRWTIIVDILRFEIAGAIKPQEISNAVPRLAFRVSAKPGSSRVDKTFWLGKDCYHVWKDKQRSG